MNLYRLTLTISTDAEMSDSDLEAICDTIQLDLDVSTTVAECVRQLLDSHAATHGLALSVSDD